MSYNLTIRQWLWSRLTTVGHCGIIKSTVELCGFFVGAHFIPLTTEHLFNFHDLIDYHKKTTKNHYTTTVYARHMHISLCVCAGLWQPQTTVPRKTTHTRLSDLDSPNMSCMDHSSLSAFPLCLTDFQPFIPCISISEAFVLMLVGLLVTVLVEGLVMMLVERLVTVLVMMLVSDNRGWCLCWSHCWWSLIL